ncbi:MAG: CoA-binding protein [Bacteroidetes bacterium]|nr:CoA-binding protein [Bacteroidota bacterium]
MVQDPEYILKKAKTILLIDWPDKNVPHSLINAGLKVYGYSPDHYNEATDKAGDIVFNRLNERPASVDIVFIYRPEAEHERILKDQVLPLGAKIIWLQPPVTSSAISRLAAEHEITIIEGINIADIAVKI